MKNIILENHLKPFIFDLENSGLSNLSCMRKHTALILEVRNMGYTVRQIVETSGISYSAIVFSSKLSQCKKNLLKPLASNKSVTESHENILHKEMQTHALNEHDEWIKAFNFNKPFSEKVISIIIPDLIKAGWNPKNYFILKEKFQILNYDQLLKVINGMRSSKFKKSIYKDGEACF